MQPATDPNIPFFEEEESKPHPNRPTVERNAINAIVYDFASDKVLCLDWHKFMWRTFVIGGIEDGEDPVVAAKREIREETGFTHVKFVGELGRTRSAYFAAHKNENRISHAIGLLFILTDPAREPVRASEAATHTVHWITKSNVSSYISLSSQRHIWEKALALLEHTSKVEMRKTARE